VTPVDDEDRVDEFAFRKLLRYLISARVHGIFAGGSAGEGPLLTRNEWEQMARIAFEECQGKVHLLGGAIDTSTKRIIEKAKVLAKIGYAHFVVAPTFYISLRVAEEHLRLFGKCKESSDGMELIAYNIPSCTGSEITVETMCEMARRGWIRYCKESSGRIEYSKRLLLEGKSLGLRVLLGDERHSGEGLLAGASGIVPVHANYDPRTFILAYEAATKRNERELARLQGQIIALAENVALGARSWIAAVKYAVASLGIGSGRPISPLEPVDAEEKKRIDTFLRQYSLRKLAGEMTFKSPP
jgi:4-hydroxy-tetrahydrodipicolinate synthase